MPQTHIRKGFFFYFGLFVLLLIAIFLVCVVIMMFNPGRSVLWMEYFTDNETYFVTETTTDNPEDIDWSTITNVEVTCSYADVTVQLDSTYDNSGLYIINNAKGFAVSEDAVDFDYQVYTTGGGGTLHIELTEPKGFIYFSDDVQIILHSTSPVNLDLSRINLTVNNTSGDVVLGGSGTPGNAELASLNVESQSGDIRFMSTFDASSLSALNLQTNSGNMDSYMPVSTGSATQDGIYTNCDVSFVTNSGRIYFDAIDVGSHSINITCESGVVVNNFMRAGQIDVKSGQGNYDFGQVYGVLSFTNSEDTILSPNIMVDEMQGDFILSTNEDSNAEPDIDIGKISGTLSILADRGSVKVDEANGAINITSAGNLGIDVTVGENNSETKTITNVNGGIRVSFMSNVLGRTDLTANGNISIYFTNVAKFNSTAYVNDGQNSTLLDDNRISITHGLVDDASKNPLQVLGTSASTGTMTIKTNGNLSYNLVTSDAI